MTFHVLVTARSFANTAGAHQDYLRENDCALDLRAPTHPYPADQLRELIAGYDGVILGLDACDASVIERADRLRAISRYGAGYDAVDLDAAAKKGIVVTNTPGANRNGVAELTIALLFSLARNVPNVVTAARANRWKREASWEVAQKTLGIIGMGAIGRAVAGLALGLNMQVIAYDPIWQGEMGGVQKSDLAAVLVQSDVITLHCALTPETVNLINAATIAQMKDKAYLINTARGELVDEMALLEALKSGKLAGAATDVLRQDPPTDHPLLQLENFLFTPHIGATTHESVQRMAMLSAQNLLAVLRGEPCQYIVNAQLLEAYRHA
ncbi:MAG: phosphoglycerate dehydrogenase [Anaerolineae bacterium]